MEEEDYDEEKEWQEYLQSQHSRKGFAQYYRCRPMAHLGMDGGYDDGNRVVMPQSALERLSSVKVEYPMVFRIQNAATLRASHVGVQEFVADEGFVHVPTHTMARLGCLGLLHGGQDDGQLVLLTSTSLPKATSVRLQPHTSDFLKVKYPKGLLENSFRKYTCMTVGDTITVVEGDRRYLLDVVEAKPGDAVSTIETDCEVDFLPPLDYKPVPARVPLQPTPPVMKTNGAGQDEGRFAGVGVRMDGKTVAQQMPPPTPAKKIAATGQGEETRFAGVGVRMDGQPVEWQSSAVVAIGPGEQRSLSFRPPPQMAGPSANNKNVLPFGAGKAGKKADDGESKWFTGKKYSLGE